MNPADKKYIRFIEKSNIFDNTYTTAYPQTTVAKAVQAHMFENDNGKKKRALIYGFDGGRADSLCYLFPGDSSFYKSKYSALAYLKEQGGLYLSYAGGDRKNPETLQETSTAQGWASILTGVWGIENGVKKHVTKRNESPTVLMQGAEKGVSGLFCAIWQDHFTITYKGEMKIAEEKDLPLKFSLVKDENALQAELIKAVDNGTGILFGINEFPDAGGHGAGFSNKNPKYISAMINADRYAAELIDRITRRDEYKDEDWLIILTSDHGGHGRRHGTQRAADRMTFIASNKKINE